VSVRVTGSLDDVPGFEVPSAPHGAEQELDPREVRRRLALLRKAGLEGDQYLTPIATQAKFARAWCRWERRHKRRKIDERARQATSRVRRTEHRLSDANTTRRLLKYAKGQKRSLATRGLDASSAIAAEAYAHELLAKLQEGQTDDRLMKQMKRAVAAAVLLLRSAESEAAPPLPRGPDCAPIMRRDAGRTRISARQSRPSSRRRARAPGDDGGSDPGGSEPPGDGGPARAARRAVDHAEQDGRGYVLRAVDFPSEYAGGNAGELLEHLPPDVLAATWDHAFARLAGIVAERDVERVAEQRVAA
jgi:hypothetical protein